MTEKIIQLVMFFAAIDIVAPPNSYAYLDPGTGSFALQIIIGVLFAVAFAVKTFWFRIKSFLGRLISRKTEYK
ncbi:MAG: hypothetical protein JSW50_16535 [Candidatus Latescibacterota bacterium]|nr:MAG: hypothetical protein JSW50_16535 [Candidatus Latescibacterota bacterium]